MRQAIKAFAQSNSHVYYCAGELPVPSPCDALKGIEVRQEFQRKGDRATWVLHWQQKDKCRDWKLVRVFPFDLKEGGITEPKVEVIEEAGQRSVRARFEIDHLNEKFQREGLNALVVLEVPKDEGSAAQKVSFVIRSSELQLEGGTSTEKSK